MKKSRMVVCGEDCWTDHRLVVSKLNLRLLLARRPQVKKAPKGHNVSKLNHDSMSQVFINDICNHLGARNRSSEDMAVYQNMVHSSAVTTLEQPSRKHQDWFDENDVEITRLLEDMHKAH